MPTYHEVERPPEQRGTMEEQLRRLHSYLYRLAEQLENVINNMTKEGDGNGNHP